MCCSVSVGKNKQVADKAQLSVFLIFLSHFYVSCDLFLIIQTKHIMESICFVCQKKKNVQIGDVSYNICPRIDHK